MQSIKGFSVRFTIIASVLVASGIFVIDISLPLGMAGAVPYGALVLIGLYAPWRHYAFVLATIATGLTLLAYFLSPSGQVEIAVVAANRFLALSVIWSTAVFCRQRRLVEDVLQDNEERYRTLVEVLEQEQEKLQKSERLLNATQELSQVGGWEYDIKTQKVLWTRETYRIHGLPVDESDLDSTKFIDFSSRCYGPKDRSKILTALRRCVEHGDTYDFELPFTSADGQQKWIRTTAKPVVENGQITSVTGNIMDITALKKIEGEVRAKAEMFEKWKSSNFIGIIQSNSTGDIIDTNDTLLSMLGYSRDDVSAGELDWTNLTPPELLHLDQNAMKEAAEMGYWNPFEKEYIHKDGHRVPIIIGGAMYQKDPDEYIVFILDITERKHLEEEQRKNQMLESLGVLAGGIAHDFNNVLTGIVGGLGILDLRLEKDTIEHQATKNALTAASRATELAQQLLTFAKGGAPIKESAAVDVLLREVTELSLHGSATYAEYKFPENLCAVDIDKGQIGQVIQNLVLNAAQAMPEGGILQITAENSVLTDQDPLPLPAGPYVKVSIADQGIGMSKEVLSKIFNPYYTTKPSGHGLGLSITHSIIQKHSGHISAQSEQGIGTLFEFYLPASSVPVQEKTEVKVPLSPGSGRILLMDDEKLIHSTVSMMLEMLGYEVESVYDGQAALQAYEVAMDQNNAYDLVIMDLTIPGAMGGKEAVGKLKSLDPQACVVVSSGYANDTIMANYDQYGFVGAINKPVVMDELAAIIKKALPERSE